MREDWSKSLLIDSLNAFPWSSSIDFSLSCRSPFLVLPAPSQPQTFQWDEQSMQPRKSKSHLSERRTRNLREDLLPSRRRIISSKMALLVESLVAWRWKRSLETFTSLLWDMGIGVGNILIILVSLIDEGRILEVLSQSFLTKYNLSLLLCLSTNFLIWFPWFQFHSDESFSCHSWVQFRSLFPRHLSASRFKRRDH